MTLSNDEAYELVMAIASGQLDDVEPIAERCGRGRRLEPERSLAPGDARESGRRLVEGSTRSPGEEVRSLEKPAGDPAETPPVTVTRWSPSSRGGTRR